MKEADLQKAVIRFLKVAAPRLLVFHPANGGTRNVREAGNLKAQGVLPGVADLVFALPDGRMACIELKTPTGRVQPSQHQFADLCANYSTTIPYAICRSIEEVASTLRGWGVQLRARAE